MDTNVYKYALGAGPNLLPEPSTTEGFQDDVMDSVRPRSAAGITKEGLIKLVATDSLSLKNLSKLMVSLGCVQAMNLDGGGSSQMRLGEKMLRPGDGRKLATAILIS
jgi:exopolysaccharide biosynthesis protein